MKLYSLLVYYKDGGGTVRCLRGAFDLKSFSFYQRCIQRVPSACAANELCRSSVQEFMSFTGKLLVERSGTPSRSSVKEQDYMCHCYVRTDNLAGVVISDLEYQSRVAMTMLSKVQ